MIRRKKCKILSFGALIFIIYIYSLTIIDNALINPDIKGSIFNNFGVDCDELQRLLKTNAEIEPGKFSDVTYLQSIKVYDGESNKTHWNIPLRPLLNCLDADEIYLEDVLKKDYLVTPANYSEGYVLNDKQSLEMKSQPQAVDVMEMVYKNKLYNGFYVEAGAADCEFSVSLPLEYNYNWTGVLIEANSKWFDRCLKKRRKSYLLHNCIGTQKRAHFAEFNFVSTGTTKDNGTTMGGFNGADNHKGEVFQVQCFNLESILNAVGQPTVNLFVLDIEGFELAVLKSINWEKVNIEVLSIETIHAGIMMKDSSLEIIIDFLKDKGYTRFHHRNDLKNDLFVRNDIVDKYNVVQL